MSYAFSLQARITPASRWSSLSERRSFLLLLESPMSVPRQAALAFALVFPSSAFAASTVFPSFQMQESSLEGFGVDNNQTTADTPFDLDNVLGGFGAQNRWVVVHPKTKDPILGSTSRVRFRLEDGAVYFEDVVASPGPVYVVARKNFGTVIDFGLGPYQSEVQLMGRDNGKVHMRVFSPITFNPLGLANTDQDRDGALKYVFRAGAGAGLDATVLAGGKGLLALRAQGDYRWSYRAGADSFTHNRGDTEWILDAGFGVRQTASSAVLAMFTYQNWQQWDYDDNSDGVERGNQVIGGRLVFRSYSTFKTVPPPPTPVPSVPPAEPASETPPTP